MPVNELTPFRQWPLPHPTNTLRDDVDRLRTSLGLSDADTNTLMLSVAGRALLNHVHSTADVTGLPQALADRSLITHNHTVDGLSNVNTTGKANGQVLIWQSPSWIPLTLQLGNVNGLESALSDRPTIAAMNAAIAAGNSALVNGAGTALDTLRELAEAMGNDPNFATTVSTSLAARVLTTTYNADMALKANAADAALTGTAQVSSVRTLTTAASSQLAVVNPTPGTDTSSFAGIRFSQTGLQERRMGMRRDGAMGIYSGTTTELWSLSPTGDMVAAGNVSAFSDQRLKTNVVRVSNALETLLRAEGVMFDKDGRRETGVIAQKLYTAIPELVNKPDDPNKMWSVKYQNALGYIIEAFRDVVEMIDEIKEDLRKKE